MQCIPQSFALPHRVWWKQWAFHAWFLGCKARFLHAARRKYQCSSEEKKRERQREREGSNLSAHPGAAVSNNLNSNQKRQCWLQILLSLKSSPPILTPIIIEEERWNEMLKEREGEFVIKFVLTEWQQFISGIFTSIPERCRKTLIQNKPPWIDFSLLLLPLRGSHVKQHRMEQLTWNKISASFTYAHIIRNVWLSFFGVTLMEKFEIKHTMTRGYQIPQRSKNTIKTQWKLLLYCKSSDAVQSINFHILVLFLMTHL